MNDLPNEKLDFCRAATLPLFVRDLLCQWLSLQPDSACAGSTAFSSTFENLALFPNASLWVETARISKTQLLQSVSTIIWSNI